MASLSLDGTLGGLARNGSVALWDTTRYAYACGL
jgi:hypothetical protein